MLSRHVSGFVLAVIAALALAATASAATNMDVRGDWDLTCGGPCGPQVHRFATQDADGNVTGYGGSPGFTSPSWTISGKVTGNQIHFTVDYNGGGYSSTNDGTISADNQTITGTFTDTAGHNLAFTMHRLSGPPSDPIPGTQPPPGGDLHPTATRVTCNRGPDPGDDSVCTATVGDGSSSPTRPTGTVHFVANDHGSFRLGPDCNLQESSTSPAIATCSVTYIPPAQPGFPDVTGTYSGDSTHASSSGTTQWLLAAVFGLPEGTPVTPAACSAAEPGAKQAGSKPRAIAHAAYNQQHQNPIDSGYQVSMGDFVGYCATNGFYNVARYGTIFGKVLGITTGTVATALGPVVVALGPTPPIKLAGGGLTVAGPAVAYSSYQLGNYVLDGIDSAQLDPPDPHYRTRVKLRVRRPFVVKAVHGVNRTDARRLTELLALQARGSGLADALSTTLDKAGGARRAGDSKWVGIQMRDAVRFARELADVLEALPAPTRAALKTLRKDKRLTRRIEASQRRRAATKYRPQLVRLLVALGYSRTDAKVLTRPSKDSAGPRSVVDVVGDQALRDLLRESALTLRYFIIAPGVVADTKL